MGIEQVTRRTSFKTFRTQSPQGVNLLEAMNKLREFEATDAQDKVYACMSVSTDACQPPADYSPSVVNVYNTFVRFQMGKDQNLDVLRVVGKPIGPPPRLAFMGAGLVNVFETDPVSGSTCWPRAHREAPRLSCVPSVFVEREIDFGRSTSDETNST